MNNTAVAFSPSSSESSLLLWLIAVVVTVMSAHVMLGWVRQAQAEPALRKSWIAMLVGAGTLGTGLCSAIVLALTSEALGFPIGFHVWAAPALWLGAMLGSLPVVALLVRSQRWWALLLAGWLLVALAAAVQVGWITAVGFRPGLRWREELAAGAVTLMVVGILSGLWTAFGDAARQRDRAALWNFVGALMVGLSIVGGQLLLMVAAGIEQQRGALYARPLSGAVLSLACGVVIPLVLAMMAVELAMRQPSRSRRSGSGKRRRHRVRGL